MRTNRVGSAVALVAVVAAVSASPAGAAQRYVSESGGNAAPCTQVSPCSIVTGVNSAGNGDEVIVAPGTYTINSTLINFSSALTVHGPAGGPQPIINSSATTGMQLSGPNATVRDLTINHTGSGSTYGLVLTNAPSLIDHVSVRSTETPCGSGATIRDSLCVATGNDNGFTFIASAGTFNLKLRNVTAIAAGNAVGVSLATQNAATASLDGRNVIARGSGSGADISALTTAATATATATMQTSNYDLVSAVGSGTESVTAAGTGTNQTAQPIFGDTTDYLQAAGSPTIDAGSTDADTGTTTDLGGSPRVQGAAIDIGADEFTPAVAPDTTPPATTIDKGPKKKTKSKKATFVFSSSEVGSTFVCKVDKKAEAPCTSPLQLKKLKKGKHTLSVVATDAAGNADATPASYRWKVKRKPKKG